MKTQLLSLPIFVLFAATGCVRQGMTEFAAMAVESEPAPEPREVRSIDVPDEGSDDAEPNVVVAAPPATPKRAEPILFHLGAGYGALGRLDLATCREQGLQAGYLHVRVTFRDSGRVVRAAVESPIAPPPEALACIGEQLRVAMVPTFEGGDVTLSRSFFVN